MRLLLGLSAVSPGCSLLMIYLAIGLPLLFQANAVVDFNIKLILPPLSRISTSSGLSNGTILNADVYSLRRGLLSFIIRSILSILCSTIFNNILFKHQVRRWIRFHVNLAIRLATLVFRLLVLVGNRHLGSFHLFISIDNILITPLINKLCIYQN